MLRHTARRATNSAIRRVILCGIVVGALATLLVSCSSYTELSRAIDQAESLAEENPNKALEIISNIDKNQLRSSEIKARYALIYSEVSYYNRMLVNSDSLTRIAVAYYDKSNHHHERARAYFQHGMTLQLAGALPEAILALREAHNSLDKYKDNRLEGVVYRLEGDIYRASYLYRNSYNAYVEALQCFERENLPYHTHYTLYNMGQAAMKMHQTDLAEELFIEARDYAIEVGNKDFLCAILHEMCEIYFQLGDKEKFSETVELFDRYDCVLWFVSHYYAMKAMATSNAGDTESAKQYAELATLDPSYDANAVERANYIICRNEGDNEGMVYWLTAMNERLRNSLLASAEQPVMNYQLDLLNMTMERDEQQMRNMRHRMIAIYAIITMVLSILVAIMIHRRKQQKRDIQLYMETIHELQLTRQNTQEPLTDAVDKLYNDRLKDLNTLCETYYEHSDTSRHATKVFEQVRQTIEAIKSDEVRLAELESLVNSCRGGLMSKLREQCPKLNERELKVALYSFAGFSSRAICVFIDSNPTALSKLKYRIKTKIKESDATDAEQLISAISDR